MDETSNKQFSIDIEAKNLEEATQIAIDRCFERDLKLISIIEVSHILRGENLYF
jgi:hypothetical protein